MLLTLYMEEQQFHPRHHHHHHYHPEVGDHNHQLDHNNHHHGGGYQGHHLYHRHDVHGLSTLFSGVSHPAVRQKPNREVRLIMTIILIIV